jgi:hypothetical protein
MCFCTGEIHPYWICILHDDFTEEMRGIINEVKVTTLQCLAGETQGRQDQDPHDDEDLRIYEDTKITATIHVDTLLCSVSVIHRFIITFHILSSINISLCQIQVVQIENKASDVWTGCFYSISEDTEQKILSCLEALDQSTSNTAAGELATTFTQSFLDADRCLYVPAPVDNFKGEIAPTRRKNSRRNQHKHPPIIQESSLVITISPQFQADWLKSRIARILSLGKDHPLWNIMENFGGMAPQQFLDTFGMWPSLALSESQTKRYPSTMEEAIQGNGKHLDSRVLEFQDGRLQAWCDFSRFHPTGDGASIRLGENVHRILLRLQATMLIDASKPPGRQIQVTTYSTVATYGPNGNFHDHVQVQLNFPEKRDGWIHFCKEMFDPKMPLPSIAESETSGNVPLPPVTSEQVAEDRHFWMWHGEDFL